MRARCPWQTLAAPPWVPARQLQVLMWEKWRGCGRGQSRMGTDEGLTGGGGPPRFPRGGHTL